MRSWTSRALPALALFLFLPTLSACEFREVTLQLPDFDTQQVRGVRFWRQIEGQDAFQRGGEVRLSAPYFEDGGEWVDYTIVYPNGVEGVTAPTRIERDPSRPGTVTLDVYYDRMFEEPGWFRVSAYNEAGNSNLSEQRVFL